MGKYFSAAKLACLDSFEYRAELVIWHVIELVPILTFMIIWTNKSSASIGGYPTSQLVMYYPLSMTISRLISYHFADYQAAKIRNGEFSQYLLKPISILGMFFVSRIAKLTFFFLIITVPVITIIGLFLHQHIFIPTLLNLILFLVMIILANLISFFLQMLIVCAAFFFKNVEGLKHVNWITQEVFGGSLLPLTFYPDWLQTVTHWLPFKFLYFLPISTYLGTISLHETLQSIGIASLWIGLLFLLYRWFWKLSIKRYSAVGG